MRAAEPKRLRTNGLGPRTVVSNSHKKKPGGYLRREGIPGMRRISSKLGMRGKKQGCRPKPAPLGKSNDGSEQTEKRPEDLPRLARNARRERDPELLTSAREASRRLGIELPRIGGSVWSAWGVELEPG